MNAHPHNPHSSEACAPLSMLPLWGLAPGRLRPDIRLCGSPERCSRRWAVEDADATVWVLEMLHPGQETRRRRIAEVLETLAERFAPIPSYRRTAAGDAAPMANGAHWQLAPYVFHDPLDRPGYLDDAALGASLGQCLAQFAAIAESADDAGGPPFSLHDFALSLVETIGRREPAYSPRASALLHGLDDFWEVLERLPVAFCHGDCHPLNILWRNGEVRALIDWEFCGMRPRLYDLANCLGCVGVERPRGLSGPFAMGLLDAMRETHLSGPDGAHLPELVLALRFAWLSEWFRYADKDLIGLELDYMTLLADNLSAVRRRWGLA